MGNICCCKRQSEYKAQMENYRIIYQHDLDYDKNINVSNFVRKVRKPKLSYEKF